MRLSTLALVGLTACGGMNAARPLAPGQHAVGVTVGGPLLDLGAPVPMPHAIVQGRHGLPQVAKRPFDIHYGLDLTGIAFGNLVIHGGAAWQFVDQNGGVPALTVVDRLHLIDNHLDFSKAAEVRSTWLLNELELLASWEIDRTLLYGGGSYVLDFNDPGLLLAPILGTEVRVGAQRRVGLQLEMRWQAINRVPTSSLVTWVPGNPGALQVTLGMNFRLGKEDEDAP